MSENKKLEFKVEGGKISFAADLDQDGKKSIDGFVSLTEAMQEAFKRGESVELEGAKVASFKIELTPQPRVVIEIDTDKDGEKVMKLYVNFAESLDEAKSLLKKS